MSADSLQFEIDDRGLDSFGISKRGKNIDPDRTEEALIRTLRQMIVVARQTRTLADAPDELEIQMGLRLSNEGFIITRGQNDASLTVKMTWRRGE